MARISGDALTTMGPTAFERAYSAGATMDYDEAIAYALDLFNRIVTEGAD